MNRHSAWFRYDNRQTDRKAAIAYYDAFLLLDERLDFSCFSLGFLLGCPISSCRVLFNLYFYNKVKFMYIKVLVK